MLIREKLSDAHSRLDQTFYKHLLSLSQDETKDLPTYEEAITQKQGEDGEALVEENSEAETANKSDESPNADADQQDLDTKSDSTLSTTSEPSSCGDRGRDGSATAAPPSGSDSQIV